MLHTDVLAWNTKKLLDSVKSKSWIKSFYLAGGTALALHYGHRVSVDLDWFTEKSFLTKSLIKKLSAHGEFKLLNEAEDTVTGLLDDVKVSFITYPYPMLKKTTMYLPGIQIASPLDIAVMKIGAIAGRNTRKNFIDLYLFLHREQMSLTTLLPYVKKKHPGVEVDLYHVFKALKYFADADKEPQPDMREVVDWNAVKKFFTLEVKKLTAKPR